MKKGYLNVPASHKDYTNSPKLPKSFFKIKLLHRTYVIVDQNHVKELIDAPESDVSFHYSERELLQLRYTFGESLANDHHHAHIIRTKLTRKIAELMPDITDELDAAFNDEFILGDGENLRLSMLILQDGYRFLYLRRHSQLSQGLIIE